MEKFDNVSILADFAEGLQALGTQLAKAELSFCSQMDNVGNVGLVGFIQTNKEKQLRRTYSIENDSMLYNSGFCRYNLKCIESMRSYCHQTKEFRYLTTEFK